MVIVCVVKRFSARVSPLRRDQRPATLIVWHPLQWIWAILGMRDTKDGKCGTPGNEECVTYRGQAGLKGSNPTLTAKLLIVNIFS
jgi:hypothetical protein